MPIPRFPFLAAFLCLSCVPVVTAQQTIPGEIPPNQPQLPASPGAINTPPPFAGTNGTPANPANQQATVVLDFQSQPVTDVLSYYETLSGKHVITDNSVQGTINLRISRPVTPAVAMRMIETALYLNGLSIVPGDDDVVKVVGLSKPPRSAGVPIFFDVADLLDNEQVVTLFYRLENLDPQETSGLLSNYVPPTSAVAFIPFPKAHALLITDTARSVRRIHDLLTQLDKPGADIKEKFIKLERADATKAVEFLNNVFETKNSGGNAPAANTANIPGTNGAVLPGSTQRRPIRRVDDNGAVVDSPGLITNAGGTTTLNRDSLIVGRVTLTAEPRTNRVHVVTTEANMEIVEKLLADYDSNTAFAAPVRFPLKFIRPDLLLPILVQSLQEGGEDKNGTTPGATNPNKNGQSSANNSNLNSGLNSSFGGLGGSSSYGGGGSGFGSLGLGSLGGSTQEIDTTPQEVAVGNNRLIADISNSAIILLGGVDAREKVAAIIAQLDRRSPQVMIHTIIGELAIGNNRELGFQYLLRTSRLGLSNNVNLLTSTTAGVTPVPTTSPTTTTSTLDTIGRLATGLGTGFTGVGGVIAVGRSLDIILAALESTNRFKTISRPMIVTSNFKKAQITSGQTITVSTGQYTGLGNTNTNNVYNQTTPVLAALTLTVTPQINSDKEVVMEVDQQLNSPLGTNSTINGASSQNLSVRQLHNYVSARNGETIVLGGLITQDDNISNSNIPYLSRIPVLGNLFRSRTREASRSELIILMQPEVVDTAGLMADLKEREENKTYLGHDLDRQVDPIEVRKAIPVRTAKVVRTRTTVTIPAGK